MFHAFSILKLPFNKVQRKRIEKKIRLKCYDSGFVSTHAQDKQTSCRIEACSEPAMEVKTVRLIVLFCTQTLI